MTASVNQELRKKLRFGPAASQGIQIWSNFCTDLRSAFPFVVLSNPIFDLESPTAFPVLFFFQ